MTTDVVGPIDFLLLEFDADKMTGEAAAALFELVEQGVIRIYDLLVLRKEPDGTIVGVDLNDVSAGSIGGFTAFAGARSGLLGDDDLAEAGRAMEPGTAAALLVYENTWAIPFVTAARNADARLIASARIPADVVMSVLDELDAADAAG
jgi:Family of unknown function (DUF6325)